MEYFEIFVKIKNKTSCICIWICVCYTDCRKLDEWKILRLDDLSSQTWFDSSEENEDEEDISNEEQSDDNELVDINEKLREKK